MIDMRKNMVEKEWRKSKGKKPKILERFHYDGDGLMVNRQGETVTPVYLDRRVRELAEENPLLHVYYDGDNEAIAGIPWEKKIIYPNGPTDTDLDTQVKRMSKLSDNTIEQRYDSPVKQKKTSDHDGKETPV